MLAQIKDLLNVPETQSFDRILNALDKSKARN